MSENKSNINWGLIIAVIVVAAGIGYLIYSMASSGASLDMNGSH
jgi:hypothetical protein